MATAAIADAVGGGSRGAGMQGTPVQVPQSHEEQSKQLLITASTENDPEAAAADDVSTLKAKMV